MIIGVGADICTIERIQRALEQFGEKFLNRIYTPGERAYSLKKKNPFPHLAGMFAAKEATRKAFGDRINGLSWTQIEVIHSASGRPILQMHAQVKQRLKAMGIHKTHLSISHDKPHAIAIVIFES